MTCGCQQNYYSFVPNPCISSYSAPQGPFPCNPVTPVVKANFTVPPANTPVTIAVSSSANLYKGQGVQIGTGYFQITDIVNSTSISISHDGDGLAEGLSVVAIHPQYGCYQYPILPVGKVTLTQTPTLAGYEADGTTAVGSSVTPTSRSLSYGYLGPKTVQYNVNLVVTVASGPVWLSVGLPVAEGEDVLNHTAAGLLYDGADWLPLLVRVLDGSSILLGMIDGSAFTNGAGRIVRVSGSYEID